MARKKKEATKSNENPTKIDNEEIKPKTLEWKQLDEYIGKPVWDDMKKTWRILDGYMRSKNTHKMTFTDIQGWVDFEDRPLYLEEVN